MFKTLTNNICNIEFEVGHAFHELGRYISKTRVFSRRLTNGLIFNNRPLFENNTLLFSYCSV